MDDNTRSVAQDALSLGQKNQAWIVGHEDLCAERFHALNQTISLMLKVMLWGGALLITTLLGSLGYMISSDQAAERSRIEILGYQMAHENRPPVPAPTAVK